MSDFGFKLDCATEALATGGGNVKERLYFAITDHLTFANVPEDPSVPKYFREKLAQIRKELSTKTWGGGLEGDRVRATLYRMHFKTAAKFAQRIWDLYNEFQEYKRSGFVPTAE